MKCHICGHPYLVRIEAVQKVHLYCQNCLHSQREHQPAYAYETETMSATGYDAGRLTNQAGWIAPELAESARVLEIGCAGGDLGAELRRLIPSLHYEAIELSPLAEQAKERLNAVHRRTLEALAHDGIVKLRSFDAIIISHVLEHIENAQSTMRLMARILKPAGRLFIEVPNWSGNAALPMDDDATHLHSFSVNSLTRLMADHGLRAASVRTERIIIAQHWEVIRAIGIPFAVPKIEQFLGTGEQFIVWGAGNRAKSVLGNFFPMADVMFFVDSDARKQGGEFLGRLVRPPAVLADYPTAPVLIAAIEAEESIRHDMRRLAAKNRTVSLSDLLRAA